MEIIIILNAKKHSDLYSEQEVINFVVCYIGSYLDLDPWLNV